MKWREDGESKVPVGVSSLAANVGAIIVGIPFGATLYYC